MHSRATLLLEEQIVPIGFNTSTRLSKMADPIWPSRRNDVFTSRCGPQTKYLSTYYLFSKSHSLPGTLVILKTAFLINERENVNSGWKDGWMDADHLLLILFLAV